MARGFAVATVAYFRLKRGDGAWWNRPTVGDDTQRELNSLAATEFSSVFGRAEVYQLTPSQSGVGNRSKPSHLLGRPLFGGDTFKCVQRRHLSGAQLKKTAITEEFGYKAFLDRYGESTQLLFVVSATKQLRINSVDEPIVPIPGDTVIAMVH